MRHLFRPVAAAVLAAVVLAACAGGEDATGTADTPAAAATGGAVPAAPDFALELADGEVFELSAEPRPVYMVFWAEW